MTIKTINVCISSATFGLVAGTFCTVAAWIGTELAYRNTTTYQTASMLERCAVAGQDGMAMITVKAGTQITCSLQQELPVKPKKAGGGV